MSSDDGWVIRQDKTGMYVLQRYSASANLPNIATNGYRFATLDEAVRRYAELDSGDYSSEYGLTVQVQPIKRENEMIQTVKYARKPFFVDAIQITAENIDDVAEWAQGEVRLDDDGTKYVHVRVHRPMTERQTKGYAGDWVLYAGTGYKVYTHKAFLASFESAETANV